MTNKLSGRIGDTPIIGAGTYANNRTCAVSCTGTDDDCDVSCTGTDDDCDVVQMIIVLWGCTGPDDDCDVGLLYISLCIHHAYMLCCGAHALMLYASLFTCVDMLC
jgi:hypothetical protein